MSKRTSTCDTFACRLSKLHRYIVMPVLSASDRQQCCTHQNSISFTGACTVMLLDTNLHRFDASERVKYKLAMLVHRCTNSRAPQYLSDYCSSVAMVESRVQTALKRSTTGPSYQLTTYGPLCRWS